MSDDRVAIANKLAKELSARPGNESVDSTWYCIAAVAFAASNFGLGVCEVYKVATEGRPVEEARTVLRRMREALLKTCPLYGIPRMLNCFYPLVETIKGKGEEYFDHQHPRANIKNPWDYVERGMKLFRHVYGDQADEFIAPYEHFPEFLQLGIHLEYGFYLSDFSILGPVETSQVVLAGLIPYDVPQVRGHMRGLLRNGGNEKDLEYVIDIALSVAKAMGVHLTLQIPNIAEVKAEA